jgi:cytochrome P450
MDFNPLSPEFRADPYPTWAALRAEDPVHVIDAMSTCVVTRYDDVVHVLKNPSLFSSSAIGMNVRGRETRTVINTDPPLHTDLRGLVNRAFTPRMVADMEPRIREITAGLLDAIAATGETDIVRDLAVPLPVTVIAELLGVDPALREDFKRWSTAVVNQDAVRQTAEAGGSADAVHDNERAMEDFTSYFEGVIEERRRRPGGNDLISAIVRAEDSDLQLTPDDLLAFTALLLIAGNETTTNLIGNAIVALLTHPDEMAKLQSDPALLPNMIEEALRWDSPVQFLFRTATADTEIAGTKIRQGLGVIPVYASANRDDARFPDAARFDVTRNTQGHLAFGYGVHFCLGAPLARLEAKVALEQALLRLPQMRRIDDAPLERVNSLFLRGLTSLPLVFDPTAVPAG